MITITEKDVPVLRGKRWDVTFVPPPVVLLVTGGIHRLRQIVEAVQSSIDAAKDRKPGDPLPIGALVTEIRTDIPQGCVRVEAVVPAGYAAEQVQSELLALIPPV